MHHTTLPHPALQNKLLSLNIPLPAPLPASVHEVFISANHLCILVHVYMQHPLIVKFTQKRSCCHDYWLLCAWRREGEISLGAVAVHEG